MTEEVVLIGFGIVLYMLCLIINDSGIVVYSKLEVMSNIIII